MRNITRGLYEEGSSATSKTFFEEVDTWWWEIFGWVYQMDKLFNSVEKSLFSSYFRETNLQFFDLEEIWPHSFLSEKYLDKTDLFPLKTVITYANVNLSIGETCLAT